MNRWKTMAMVGALAMAAWVPSVGAQTTTPVPDPQAHQDRRELRRDQRDLRQDRQDMRRDGRDIRQDKQDLRTDRQDRYRDRQTVRQDEKRSSRIGRQVTGPPSGRISATSIATAAVSTRTEGTSAPTIGTGVKIIAR